MSIKMKSFSPDSNKENWNYENDLEYLKNGLQKYKNINHESIKPDVFKEQKEIMNNFDRLRRSFLKHKETNRNLRLDSIK